MSENKRICLGKVVGVHGLQGDVKIKSFTEVEEDLVSYGQLGNENATKFYDVKIVGVQKGTLRARIKGCNDRNSAEAIVGTEFWISKDLLPELAEEEFYHEDLIGLDVRLDESSEVIGKVIGVHNFGAGDILDIEVSNSKKTAMIHFTERYVPNILLAKKTIIVSSEFLNLLDDKKEGDNEG